MDKKLYTEIDSQMNSLKDVSSDHVMHIATIWYLLVHNISLLLGMTKSGANFSISLTTVLITAEACGR